MSASAGRIGGKTSGAPCTVVCYPHAASRDPNGHDARTRAWAARKLAELKGCKFGGDYDETVAYPGNLYFVPKHTLCPVEFAGSLGIRCEHDLFGGVAPHEFVATKAITHGLVDADSQAPAGWSHEFGRRVREVVLPGITAFSLRDAQAAGTRLLSDGRVRIKDPDGVGGLGQTVVADRDELEVHLRSIDEQALTSSGMVFERNLDAQGLETLSLGQVRAAGLLVTYFGTQRLTANHRGQQVYGGSELVVCRGGFDVLPARAPSKQIRMAIDQARVYHEAAFESFRGMFASRCNYDVVQGFDDSGKWHSGVLEQSWRIGGASAAELLALQAFQQDPALDAVVASTVEIYGTQPQVPAGATIYFSGTDAHVGPLTKYATLEPYAGS